MSGAASRRAGPPALAFAAARTALPVPQAGQGVKAAHAIEGVGDFSGRCFLFLQGPASPFGFRLAQALAGHGARIVKVHLCGGDLVFWPSRARLFRGRLEDWPDYLERLMAEESVSDVVLFGDCRPYHAPAVRLGHARGTRLHLLEEGYVRPGRITCERHGVNAHSDLPRTPETLVAMAATVTEPSSRAPLPEPFLRRALWDVAWHAGFATLSPLFHRYRRHTLVHPAVDYAGWIIRWLSSSTAVKRDRLARARLGEGARYFLLPLQLEGDYQIRAHSNFRSVEEVVRLVLGSFARAAAPDARLAIKRHPYDTSLPATRRMVERVAAEFGLTERIVFIEGGDIEPLVKASAGVVLVNSTTALQALRHSKPLKVLGRATYDMPGLAHQGPLDGFWHEPAAPDPRLVEAYRRVVLARTQIAGGFFAPAAIDRAVAGLVARMAEETQPA